MLQPYNLQLYANQRAVCSLYAALVSFIYNTTDSTSRVSVCLVTRQCYNMRAAVAALIIEDTFQCLQHF
jgi:hypothetical protein